MTGWTWSTGDLDEEPRPRPRVARNYDEDDPKDQPGVPRHRED